MALAGYMLHSHQHLRKYTPFLQSNDHTHESPAAPPKATNEEPEAAPATQKPRQPPNTWDVTSSMPLGPYRADSTVHHTALPPPDDHISRMDSPLTPTPTPQTRLGVTSGARSNSLGADGPDKSKHYAPWPASTHTTPQVQRNSSHPGAPTDGTYQFDMNILVTFNMNFLHCTFAVSFCWIRYISLFYVVLSH